MSKKTKSEKQFIVGTEGNPDYLVVASLAGHVLGVKPITLQMPDRTYLGVRVRSVYKAQEGDMVSENEVVSITHKDAFDIDFDKQDESRASTMFLASVPRMIWQQDDLITAVEAIDVGGKVARWLSQRVGDVNLTLPLNEIAEFVCEGVVKSINDTVENSNLLPTEPVDPLQQMLQPPQWQAKKAEAVTAVGQKAKKAGLTLINGGGDDNQD